MKIGMMSFAHSHAYSYANALKQLPLVELTAVYDNHEERGKAAAERYDMAFFSDMDDFLSVEMDAVIICSENMLHKEMVVRAAETGKHILCEKPIATTLCDAREMIEACETHHVILQIAFPVRFNSAIAQLKQHIDEGKLGEIVAIRTTNRGQNPGGWFIDPSLSGGGAVLDHTVHMVDIMRWYLNEEVKEVYSLVGSYFHGIETDDAGILTLEFENGVIATHDASWSKFANYPTWGDVKIEVMGTKQTVRVDMLKEHLRMYSAGEKPLKFLTYHNDMNLGLIKDFVDCVEKEREPSITGYDGLKALEVALRAYESGEKGERVKV